MERSVAFEGRAWTEASELGLKDVPALGDLPTSWPGPPAGRHSRWRARLPRAAAGKLSWSCNVGCPLCFGGLTGSICGHPQMSGSETRDGDRGDRCTHVAGHRPSLSSRWSSLFTPSASRKKRGIQLDRSRLLARSPLPGPSAKRRVPVRPMGALSQSRKTLGGGAPWSSVAEYHAG